MEPWLNYHHLLYFSVIVEEGGVQLAAKRLGVTHPTVSEQLKSLEASLGLNLFSRQGRRLQLTEDGRMVYGHARQIFGMGATLREAVEAARSGQAIVCRVGVDSVLAKLVVRRALAPIMDGLGDDGRLRCMEDERAPLLASLQARNLDLVLTDAPAGVTGFEGIVSTQAAKSTLGIFAAPALAERYRPDFPRSLDRAPFLLPMTATRIRRGLERWLGEHRLRPRVVGELEDSGLIKILGQEGRGVFAMPMSVREEVCTQYEVEFLGEAEGVETGVFAIYRDEEHPAVDLLIRSL